MSESNNHARTVELSDLSAIMRTDSGRKVLARILRATGFNDLVYVKGDHDETIRRAVKRDFGMWLSKELKEADEHLYHILLKEIDNG